MVVSNDLWEKLTAAAKEASKHAYCPYSKFPVGAALLASDGKIYSGCNVENASYGLTICAERNALFHAVAESTEAIPAIVVYTPTSKPTVPCGACRQVLNEFGSQTIVRCVCDGPEKVEAILSDLLPSAFNLNNFI